MTYYGENRSKKEFIPLGCYLLFSPTGSTWECLSSGSPRSSHLFRRFSDFQGMWATEFIGRNKESKGLMRESPFNKSSTSCSNGASTNFLARQEGSLKHVWISCTRFRALTLCANGRHNEVISLFHPDTRGWRMVLVGALHARCFY